MGAYAPPSGAEEREQGVAGQSRYSARLLAAINAYRVEHGVVDLKAAANLDVLAHEHSKDMERVGQLSHEGFRLRAMRSDSQACVENVGWNYAGPEAQLRGWVKSPAHNMNLLDPEVIRAGIGNANAYVTFIACR